MFLLLACIEYDLTFKITKIQCDTDKETPVLIVDIQCLYIYLVNPILQAKDAILTR